MKKSELAHILRAASKIVGDSRILVIGSQSILGSFPEDDLPKVDGGIGEDSMFHETLRRVRPGGWTQHGQAASGWQDRLVPFLDPEADPSEAYCLEVHDLVVSKLVAGREKDCRFARALLEVGLVDADTLVARAELLPVIPAIKRRVIGWLSPFQGLTEDPERA